MEDKGKGLTAFVNEVFEKANFANNYPLLIRATADNETPTPGYLYQEITKICHSCPADCDNLQLFLLKKLDKNSHHVKIKVLKILLHLIQNSHVEFRKNLRKRDKVLKDALAYSGPPDTVHGSAPYEAVRKLAEELLSLLFHPEQMAKDEDDSGSQWQALEPVQSQLGGLGTSGTKGKYEGFGNSLLHKEDTVAVKVLDLVDRIWNSDETEKIVKEAVSSSPGLYEPVKVVPGNHSANCEPTPSLLDVSKVKPHVPGKAGGGWESDGDDETDDHQWVPSRSPNRESTVSTDSLEKSTIVGPEETSLESVLINEFCSQEVLPVNRAQLDETGKRCLVLNRVNIINALNEQLMTKNPIRVTKVLLLTEWLLRKDSDCPMTISGVLTPALKILQESTDVDDAVRIKAKKVDLILQKLQIVT